MSSLNIQQHDLFCVDWGLFVEARPSRADQDQTWTTGFRSAVLNTAGLGGPLVESARKCQSRITRLCQNHQIEVLWAGRIDGAEGKKYDGFPRN